MVIAISACGRADNNDNQASIDFLAGGGQWLEFRNNYDQRISELMDSCLRRAGFDPTIFAEPSVPPMPTVASEEKRYYGIVDNLELMREYDETVTPVTRPVQVTGAERAAYEEARRGNAETPGCYQEAQTVADAEFRIAEVEAIGQLYVELRMDSGVSVDYQQRLDEWSMCMAEQGIPRLSSPATISDLVTEQWFLDSERTDQSERALNLERSIFVAEQECPSHEGDISAEQAAEQLLERHPHVEELLSGLLSN